MEDGFQMIGRDADAGVRDRQLEPGTACTWRDAYADRTVRRELYRIAHQIERDLPQAKAVADHPFRKVVGNIQFQCDLLFPGYGFHQPHHAGQLVAHVHRFLRHAHQPGLDLRYVEDVVEQLHHAASGFVDQAHVIRLPVAQIGLFQQLGEAKQAVHRRANVVAHVRQERGFGRGGIFRRQPGCAKFGFQLLGMRYIADGRDDFDRPPGAMIVHGRAIGFHPAIGLGLVDRSRAKRDQRTFPAAICQSGESVMNARIVVRMESGQQVGSDQRTQRQFEQIPRRWRGVNAGPLQVETHHRIGDVFGDQGQLLVSPGQGGDGFMMLGHVDVHADEAGDLSGLVEFGPSDGVDPHDRPVAMKPAELQTAFRPAFDRTGPFRMHPVAILGMYCAGPAVALPFIGSQPGKTQPRRVDIGAAAFGIGAEYACGCQIGQGLKAAFAGLQLFARLFLLGDIDSRAVISGHGTILVELGRIVGIHPQARPVRRPKFQRTPPDHARFETPERRVGLYRLERCQRIDPSTPKHFVDGFADLVRPGRIDEGQLPLTVRLENPDGGGFGKGAESLLAIRQGLFLTYLLGHIADISDCPGKSSALVGCSPDADLDMSACAPFIDETLGQGRLAKLSAHKGGIDLTCRCKILGHQQFRGGPAQRLLDGIAGQCFPCGVERGPPTVLIRAEDDFADVIEDFLLVVPALADQVPVADAPFQHGGDRQADRKIAGEEYLESEQLVFDGPAHQRDRPCIQGRGNRCDCGHDQHGNGRTVHPGPESCIKDQRTRQEQERILRLGEDDDAAADDDRNHRSPFGRAMLGRQTAFTPRVDPDQGKRQNDQQAQPVGQHPSLPLPEERRCIAPG